MLSDILFVLFYMPTLLWLGYVVLSAILVGLGVLE